jgi:transcriptional regulator with XRE-family HTH domain
MLTFISPHDCMLEVANRAKELRLSQNLSRKTLAAKSGVSEPSIKRFECTGEIAFLSLLKIAHAMGCLDDFSQVFGPRPIISIEQVLQKPRSRGRN